MTLSQKHHPFAASKKKRWPVSYIFLKFTLNIVVKLQSGGTEDAFLFGALYSRGTKLSSVPCCFKQSLGTISICLFAILSYIIPDTNCSCSDATAACSEPPHQSISEITGNELSKQSANRSPRGHACSPAFNSPKTVPLLWSPVSKWISSYVQVNTFPYPCLLIIVIF